MLLFLIPLMVENRCSTVHLVMMTSVITALRVTVRDPASDAMASGNCDNRRAGLSALYMGLWRGFFC